MSYSHKFNRNAFGHIAQSEGCHTVHSKFRVYSKEPVHFWFFNITYSATQKAFNVTKITLTEI